MEQLTNEDLELIAKAQKVIQSNYDQVHQNHTVGAAVRCKNGACAEQVAIGSAITDGERDFDVMVAVRGKEGEEIIPPCGNCRQILHDYMPDCEIIVPVCGELKKIKAEELLPFSYSVE